MRAPTVDWEDRLAQVQRREMRGGRPQNAGRLLWPVMLTVLAGLVGAELEAQTVRGQVKDRTTGKPALGVVTLVDTGGVIIGRTPTGPQGQYALTAPGPGRYLLQFVGPGYGPYVTRDFGLAAGETRILGIEVVPLPVVALDTVIVEGRPVPRRLAGFYQRQSSGMGQFISREEFERNPARQLTEFLRPMVGITVVRSELGNRVVSRRSPGCAPAVFLDGVFMGTGADFDFDGVLTAEQVEGVEVYAGGGQVPPEFNRGDCGALVIWTRVTGPGVAGTRSHLYLGADAGGWLSADGFRQGRSGVRAVIGMGHLELSPAVRVLVPSWRAAAVEEESGTEVLLSVRGRPFGQRRPWYVGLGLTALQLNTPRGTDIDEDHFLLLAGAAPSRGRLQPFLEVQAVSPTGGLRWQVFAGLAFRLY